MQKIEKMAISKFRNMLCDVLLTDQSQEEIEAMVDYCDEHKLKLLSFSNTDVSDVGRWDTVAIFQFETEEDALAFKLRFRCQ
jgi:hypothetical protein